MIDFAKRIGLILLAIAGTVIGFGWGFRECRHKEYFQGRTAKLQRDSVNWRADSLGFLVIIGRQTNQFKDVLLLSTNYKKGRDSLMTVSDKTRSLLTYQAKQTATYKALVANQTLSPIYLRDTLRVAIPDTAVLDATLKTIDREAIGRTVLDNLEKSVAARDVQIEDLKKQRDRAVASSLYAEDSWLAESQTKRFLGRGRKKNARLQAAEVRRQRQRSNSVLGEAPASSGSATPPRAADPGVSDLEKELLKRP